MDDMPAAFGPKKCTPIRKQLATKIRKIQRKLHPKRVQQKKGRK
jgi:hypothetical protein